MHRDRQPNQSDAKRKRALIRSNESGGKRAAAQITYFVKFVNGVGVVVFMMILLCLAAGEHSI